jgi:hypothetical protein
LIKFISKNLFKSQDRPIGVGLLPLKAPKAFFIQMGEGLQCDETKGPSTHESIFGHGKVLSSTKIK